jgi:hypothetical protein
LNSQSSNHDDFDARLTRITSGIARVKSTTQLDPKDVEEIVALAIGKVRAEVSNELLLIKLREKYGRNIIRFLWVYFGFTSICILLNATQSMLFSATLSFSETVLAALVGGTAVSVLGVVGTVAAGLFRPPRA